MKNLKSIMLASALSASLAMPTFASVAPVSAPLPQFTEADTAMLFEQDASPMQLAVLSQQEMQDTEGAVAPLVALGIIHGGRFVAQRWVTQRVAAQVLAQARFSNPTYGAWSRTAQQSRTLAKQAWGSKNVIRHGPSGHVRTKVNYSHFQNRSQSIRGHSYYGKQHR